MRQTLTGRSLKFMRRNFPIGDDTLTIQTSDMSEETHHRPHRGHGNLAQDKFAPANAVLG